MLLLAVDASLPMNRPPVGLFSDMGKIGVVVLKPALHAKCARSLQRAGTFYLNLTRMRQGDDSLRPSVTVTAASSCLTQHIAIPLSQPAHHLGPPDMFWLHHFR